MRQDLHAPPTLTVRRVAVSAILCGSAGLAIDLGLALAGWMSWLSALARTAVALVFLIGLVHTSARVLPAAARVRPERMPFVHAALSGVGFLLAFGCAAAFLGGTRFGDGVFGMWWMVPLMFGVTLAGGGAARRVGDSLHCPRCEYEFVFADMPDPPIRCPECGSGWLGMLKKGRRVRSGRMIAGGLALAAAAGLLGNSILYMSWLAPHLPTPVLFASLYASPTKRYGIWDELGRRKLSPRWARAMAERVLAQRHVYEWDNSPGRWFEAAASAGSIPPDLAERFYAEGFRAELLVPDHVKAGAKFWAKLRVTGAADGASDLGVMFAGYTVGDDSAPVGREPKTVWGFELRPDVFATHRDVLGHALRVDKPGDVRVHAVYWIVYQPSFWEQLDWQPDGTPKHPARAAWFKRCELEKTVHVE